MYTHSNRKKTEASQSARRTDSPSGLRTGAAPNSALIGYLEEKPGSLENLEARLFQRLPGVQARPQAQIPQAESEADRLSASVTGGSPEAVKAAMGQKMGADFSGVRFHTGAEAAQKADAMGALAYTSGADVYFGSGGFDPSVAAHELVHTAQQGMVSSSVSTMSTPVGGIQMASGSSSAATPSLRDRAKAKVKKVKEGASKKADYVKDRTVGRIGRWHEESIDDLHAVQQRDASGQRGWDKLSTGQKAAWMGKNFLAYGHYKLGGEKTANKAKDRATARENRTRAAEAFLLTKNLDDKKHTLMTSEEVDFLSSAPNPDRAAAGAPARPTVVKDAPGGGKTVRILPELETKAAKKGAKTAQMMTDAAISGDVASTSLGFSGKVAAAAASSSATGVTQGAGGVGVALNAMNTYSSAQSAVEAMEKRDKVNAYAHATDAVANAAATGAAVNDTLGNVSSETAGGVLGLIGGAINASTGAYRATLADGQVKVADEIMDGKNRDTLNDVQRFQYDMAQQQRMEGERKRIQGIGLSVSGFVDVAAGLSDLTGGGAILGAALHGTGAAIRAGTEIAAEHKLRDERAAVLEQATGVSPAMIEEFRVAQGLPDTEEGRRQAKRAIVMALGGSSGYREEIRADQLTKRGKVAAKRANMDENSPEAKMLHIAGVRKRALTPGGAVEYQHKDAISAMGRDKKRREVVAGAMPLQIAVKEASYVPPTAAPAAATTTPAAATTTPAAATTTPAAATTTPAAAITTPAAATTTPAAATTTPAAATTTPAAATTIPAAQRPLPAPPSAAPAAAQRSLPAPPSTPAAAQRPLPAPPSTSAAAQRPLPAPPSTPAVAQRPLPAPPSAAPAVQRPLPAPPSTPAAPVRRRVRVSAP